MLGGWGRSYELNDAETQYDRFDDVAHEAGLDIKYGVTSNYTLDLTANTEFAQVEGITALACQNPLHMPPEYQALVLSLSGRKAIYTGCAPTEIRTILGRFGTRGIFLVTSADSVEEAHALLHDLQRWTQHSRRE